MKNIQKTRKGKGKAKFGKKPEVSTGTKERKTRFEKDFQDFIEYEIDNNEDLDNQLKQMKIQYSSTFKQQKQQPGIIHSGNDSGPFYVDRKGDLSNKEEYSINEDDSKKPVDEFTEQVELSFMQHILQAVKDNRAKLETAQEPYQNHEISLNVTTGGKASKKKNKGKNTGKEKQREILSEDSISDSLVNDYLLNASDVEHISARILNGPDYEEDDGFITEDSEQDSSYSGSSNSSLEDFSDSTQDERFAGQLNHEEEEDEVLYVASLKKRIAPMKNVNDRPSGSYLVHSRLKRLESRHVRAKELEEELKIEDDVSIKLDGSFNRFIEWLKSDSNQISLEPMPRAARKFFHAAANKAGCRTKSIGSGNSRFTIFYRTNDTITFSKSQESHLWRQMERLRPIMEIHERNLDLRGSTKKTQRNIGKSSVSKGKKKDNRRKSESGKVMKRNNKEEPSSQMKHGFVVGNEAEPIGQSNKGHALLMKMGWKPGDSIGSTSAEKALKEPLEAVFRAKKRGLGY